MKKFLLMMVVIFAFAGVSFAADPVDLNTATQQQLESIKGIGPKKAQAIIDYREKNGNFKSIDDLDNVKGFSAKGVGKIRDQVTVSGAASEKPAGSGEPATSEGPANIE